TGDPDTALVGFDKTLYQGQAQAQPAMTPGLRPILLTKTFKHKRNKVSRNTLAGIFHLDNEIVTLRMTTHRYRAAGRRELDCIIEQVDERLAQSNSITGNNFVLPLAESEFDSDLARLRHRTHRLNRLAHCALQSQRHLFHAHLAAQNGRHVEQVI